MTRSSTSDLGSLISKCCLTFLVVLVAGCQTGTLSNPNDISSAGDDTPNVIMRQLQSTSDALNYRKFKHEITDRQYRQMITQIARNYISQAKDTTVTDDNARAWSQVMITAREWDKAEPLLRRAIKVEQIKASEDYLILGNWVGDVLSLASAQAHLGKVHEAVQTARSVFHVPPKAKAPILSAVLYDIAPGGAGKGDDLELASLVRDAIEQQQQVLVDPNSDAGRGFLLARPGLIKRGWDEAALLYASAGRMDLADEALRQSHQTETTTVKV